MASHKFQVGEIVNLRPIVSRNRAWRCLRGDNNPLSIDGDIDLKSNIQSFVKTPRHNVMAFDVADRKTLYVSIPRGTKKRKGLQLMATTRAAFKIKYSS